MGTNTAERKMERRKRVEEMVKTFERQGGIVLNKETDVAQEIQELREE